MSDIRFNLVSDTGDGAVSNVVAIFPERDKPIMQADSNHPNWNRIIEGLNNGDAGVYDLFDIQGNLVKKMTKISDRVTFDGSNIRFDGDIQDGPLADHLVRCLENDVDSYEPVVRFWEKVATNPDERSREQMFTWLRSHSFTITESGDILGYKGVYGYDGDYTSVHSGQAWVDGVEIKGQIPNKVGTEVTMPRSKVANDPDVACHYGLHVGDWSYASSFAQTVLEVHVNPRDVVSIPRDSSQRKMRCCKYKVVKVRTAPSQKPIEVDAPVDDWKNEVGYRPY